MSSLYHKNIQIIQQKNKTLADKIEASQDFAAQLIVTQSQHPTFQYSFNKKPVYMYSKIHPKKEITRFIEQEDILAYSHFVIFGFGLGYIAEELLIKHPKLQTILIYEASLSMFHTALKARDLTPILNSKKIYLYIEEDIFLLTHHLNRHAYLGYSRFKIISKQQIINQHAAYYSALKTSLLNKIKTFAISFGMKFDSKRIIEYENLLQNIHPNPTYYGVGHFFNQLTNIPAVCVGAGPSLEKNIPILQKTKNSVVIIACDTAVRKLLEFDIVPHFITTADPFDHNYKNFEGLFPQLTQTPLIADFGSNPTIIRNYPGPVFFYKNPGIFSDWIQGFLPQFEKLSRGFSVALLSYYFAIELKSAPIILMGQDLCYYPDKFYGSGVKKNIKIQTDNQRRPYMMKGDPQRGNFKIFLIPEKDINKHPVWTTDEFLNVKLVFEESIEALNTKTINATEGGLTIRNAENLTLKKALSPFKTDAQLLQKIESIIQHAAPVNTAVLNTELNGLLKLAEKIKSSTTEALRLLENNAFAKHHAVIESAREDLFKHPHLQRMIETLFSANIFVIKNRPDYAILQQPLPQTICPESKETLLLFFSTVLTGCEFLINRSVVKPVRYHL